MPAKPVPPHAKGRPDPGGSTGRHGSPYEQPALRRRGRLEAAHPVKQIHTGQRRPHQADRRQEPQPLDPRHPDAVEAHQLARRSGSHDSGRKAFPGGRRLTWADPR